MQMGRVGGSKNCVCRGDVAVTQLGRALLERMRVGVGGGDNLSALVLRLVKMVRDMRTEGGYEDEQMVADTDAGSESDLTARVQEVAEGRGCEQTDVEVQETEGGSCGWRADDNEFDGMVVTPRFLTPESHGASAGDLTQTLSQEKVAVGDDSVRGGGMPRGGSTGDATAGEDDGEELVVGRIDRDDVVNSDVEDLPLYLGVLVCVRDRQMNTALLAQGLHDVFGGKVRYTMWAIEQVTTKSPPPLMLLGSFLHLAFCAQGLHVRLRVRVYLCHHP